MTDLMTRKAFQRLKGKEMRCKGCIFYTDGHCHKAPPEVFPDNYGGSITRWPMPGKEGWCGDWNEGLQSEKK